jgi:hypothetical protein
MFQVQTTPEYDKCLKGLLTRGKIGKEAYRTARVAEAEAHEGDIRTISRTHHGENRLPDAEKYDLPGDYRLVIQRGGGKEPVTIFRFVGDHEEAERWLENRRGEARQPKRKPKAVPDPHEQFEQEKRRREREQREWEEMVDILEQENSQLNNNLLDRERVLEKQKADVEKAAKKQEESEAEIVQLAQERDVLAVKVEQFAKEKDESVGAARREVEKELASKLVHLQESHQRQEENRKQLVFSRQQLVGVQKQVEGEKESLKQALQAREAQLLKFKSHVRRLQNQLDRVPVAEPLQDNKFWLWAFLIAAGLILVLVVILSIISQRRPMVPPATLPATGSSTAKPQPVPGARGSPDEKAAADGPVNPPKPTQPEPRVEKVPLGPPATEKQMDYVAGLVRRKGWSETDRDAEINKLLGYVRSYRNLTKREASTLIDAWK